MSDIRDRIHLLVRTIANDEDGRGVLSTGELIAVALVLNRADWLAEGSAGYRTILEAIERLGPEWMLAALAVQREHGSDPQGYQ